MVPQPKNYTLADAGRAGGVTRRCDSAESDTRSNDQSAVRCQINTNLQALKGFISPVPAVNIEL